MVSGERLPLLLDGQGQPLFEPTVYTLTELRTRNQATTTISSDLKAIQVFYMFLDVRGNERAWCGGAAWTQGGRGITGCRDKRGRNGDRDVNRARLRF
jgi:hypothetical protein